MGSHLKTLHLYSDEHKNTIREIIEKNLDLVTTFDETLRGVGQWICERCMNIHAMSRTCHNPTSQGGC